MPGPRMLVLMLTPAMMAIALVLLVRRDRGVSANTRVRGGWLAFAALAVHLGVRFSWGHTNFDEYAVNRVGAAAVLFLLGCFAWVNRDRARATVVGVWLVASGAGLNAVATLLYGAMPVLGSAARTAGYDVGDAGHPFSGYVLSDHMSPVAKYTGDFLPISGQLKVLSIGDLLLIAGLVVVFVQALRSVAHPDLAEPPRAPSVTAPPNEGVPMNHDRELLKARLYVGAAGLVTTALAFYAIAAPFGAGN